MAAVQTQPLIKFIAPPVASTLHFLYKVRNLWAFLYDNSLC